MSSIGERIKELRKKEELTQKEFAQRILVSPSYISGIEHGNEIPTDKFMKLVALEFGVSLNWIENGIGEMYSQYYDDSIESSAEAINNAMAEIWGQLNSGSNSIYHGIANVLLGVGNSIKLAKRMTSESACCYLEKLAELLCDLERGLDIKMKGADDATLHKHRKGISDSVEEVFQTVQHIKRNV